MFLRKSEPRENIGLGKNVRQIHKQRFQGIRARRQGDKRRIDLPTLLGCVHYNNFAVLDFSGDYHHAYKVYGEIREKGLLLKHSVEKVIVYKVAIAQNG